MKSVFYAAFAANLVLTVAAFFLLPEKVAIQFGAGGAPGSWASRGAYVAIMLAIEVPLFLLIASAPYLTAKLPPSLVNLPNKQYWLRPENLPALKRRLGGIMAEFGAALYGFFLIAGILTLRANLARPVRFNEKFFLLALALFFVYVVFWSVRVWRTFRIPPGAGAY